MFKRSFRSRDASAPLDAHRVDKYARLVKKGPGGGSAREKKLQRSFAAAEDRAQGSSPSLAPSPIVTLMVGAEGRLFAAHEDVLCQSPFFGGLLQRTPQDAQLGKRISLPDEEPEVFSAVLEYLYKGDYYPRLLQHPGSSKHRSSWYLEDSLPSGGHRTTPQHSPALGSASPRSGSTPRTPAPTSVEATVWLGSLGDYVLRDTVIYCAADRYGLEELKSLALRKQGLQSGIDVATILRSAQYAYAHTPDSDSRLRAHYLALIIRCRKTFKRSGTMQAEMEGTNPGGKLFFDLFVAMCNHLDDVIDASNARTPKTV